MSMKLLKELLLEIRKIASIESLLHWDQETKMPEGSGDIRAEHMAYLSSQSHHLQTGEQFHTLLEEHVNIDSGEPLNPQLDQETRRLLFLIWKEYRDSAALPTKFVEEFTRHSAKTQQVWEKTREKNDFKTFAPYLQKMIDMKKQEAEYYGYETTPYDSLLDKFEPKMTSEQITTLFDEVRVPLVQLVQKINDSKTIINDKPLKLKFEPTQQWAFWKDVSQKMGFDFTRGRLDKSAHPFTISFHPTDVRITTRVKETDFKSGLFATIHESGHGLYEQGLPEEDYGTPFGEAISMGIHESQSRLWENCVGRSKLFWHHFFPILKKQFKKQLKRINLDYFYKMINTVNPSLIRVDADEVTYSLHIMLRFEIEKMLINENLKAEQLPEVWNQKMSDYLGIRPEDDKDGVMQDVHWSSGLFGYFPTYALGNFYASSIMNQAWKEIPQLAEKISSGELLPLRDWLREKIHSKGQRRYAGELIHELTGKPLSAKPFLQYLQAKYSEIYQLSIN